MLSVKNAVIKNVSLGFEDHGFLTFYIYLDYGGEGQAIGGICVTNNGEPDSFGAFMACMLKAFKVSKWEDLKGKSCRVLSDENKVHEVSHFIHDTWFNIHKFYNQDCYAEKYFNTGKGE